MRPNYTSVIRWFAQGIATVLTIAIVPTIPGFSQSRFNTAVIVESNANKNLFRSEDIAMNQNGAARPYVLYGNDFHGTSNFFLSFNLESRQTVRYQLVDIMGKELAKDDIPAVLNQTYRIETNNVASGTYIVRLMIDHKCYTEKVFFTP
jgi:hypothetical protein